MPGGRVVRTLGSGLYRVGLTAIRDAPQPYRQADTIPVKGDQAHYPLMALTCFRSPSMYGTERLAKFRYSVVPLNRGNVAVVDIVPKIASVSVKEPVTATHVGGELDTTDVPLCHDW